MRLRLLALSLLLATSAQAAESIVPMSLWLPNTTFTATSPWLRVDFPVAPDGTIAIVGWKVWYYDTGKLGMYGELRLWHDGGTAHALDAMVWTAPPSFATWNGGHVASDRPAVMLPDPGHPMVPGDQLYAEMHCYPLPSVGQCSMEAGVTVYLRVVTP